MGRSKKKKGATIIKLNTTITNLNVCRMIMSHCSRDKDTECVPLELVGFWTFSILWNSK
jgi:hypothetical protein